MIYEAAVLVVGTAAGLLWVQSEPDQPQPARLARFARLQRLPPGFFSPGVWHYLRVTRLWRGVGLTAGAVVSALQFGIYASPLLLGWFAGVLVAEHRLARARPRTPPARVALLSPAATAFWSVCLGVTVGLLVRVVILDPAELTARLGAFAALAVLLAVLSLLSRLHTAHEYVDETAVRARSAQVLATGGGVSTVWLALGAAPLGPALGIAASALSLVALFIGTRPATGRPSSRPWWIPASAGLVLAPAVALIPPAPGAQVHMGVQYATRQACSDAGCTHWVLDGGRPLPEADADPFVIHPDGTAVVYRDRTTGRLVLRDFLKDTARDLPGDGEPAFSPDGRHLATTGHLIDLTSGKELPIPGLVRVVGLSDRAVVGLTAPRTTLDGELVAYDFQGRVVSRAPFDPSQPAWLIPGGKEVFVLTRWGDAAQMEVATGKVRARHRLDTGASVDFRGWDGPDRALISDWYTLRILDLASGKLSRAPADYARHTVHREIRS
ncbi:hypothetical protein ACIBG7_03880 [Nonomuraea sp. NPDC050328]|uniref:hypothetical protein n=1 Tax=Nonomuraea sp. NPDC050328 TaxID=3364361 RepID=UPI0037BB335B